MQPLMHGLDDRLLLLAASNVGLVGRDDEQVTSILQLGTSFCHAGEKVEVRQRIRRVRFAIADDLYVKRPISVEKDSGT